MLVGEDKETIYQTPRTNYTSSTLVSQSSLQDILSPPRTDASKFYILLLM